MEGILTQVRAHAGLPATDCCAAAVANTHGDSSRNSSQHEQSLYSWWHARIHLYSRVQQPRKYVEYVFMYSRVATQIHATAKATTTCANTHKHMSPLWAQAHTRRLWNTIINGFGSSSRGSAKTNIRSVLCACLCVCMCSCAKTREKDAHTHPQQMYVPQISVHIDAKEMWSHMITITCTIESV